jgi:WD40 repeat protein
MGILFQGHEDTITVLIIDEFILFSASEDHSIRTWDCLRMYPLQVFEYHKSQIELMILVESTLITSSNDGMVFFFHYPKSELQAKFRKKDGRIFSLAFSHESRVLFLGSESENILKLNFDELLQEHKDKHKIKNKSEASTSRLQE